MDIITSWLRAKSENKSPSPIEEPTLKIENFPEMFSEKIVTIILQEEKNTGNVYIGGDFNINYVDKWSYSCSYELYFKDQEEQPYKIAAESKPMSNAKLFPESINDLAKEKNITFEIPEPSEEDRENFNSKSDVNIGDIFAFLLRGKK